MHYRRGIFLGAVFMVIFSLSLMTPKVKLEIKESVNHTLFNIDVTAVIDSPTKSVHTIMVNDQSGLALKNAKITLTTGEVAYTDEKGLAHFINLKAGEHPFTVWSGGQFTRGKFSIPQNTPQTQSNLILASSQPKLADNWQLLVVLAMLVVFVEIINRLGSFRLRYKMHSR